MENINIDRSWIEKKNSPLVISGPCSAESEKQILDTAKELSLKNHSYVQIFRAGIWKPRTKPNNFEGIGEEGLRWMKKVKKETGLMVATEVANGKHVELCLSYDIDILWIGARTTASPFSIQEIAEALEGRNDQIVLIKNPIHPDIDLWIGALERFYQKGIKKLGMIHRGFYILKNEKYRNQPNWKFLLEIKKILPSVPIFCDPSHICGNKIGIFETSKIAYHFFKCDGLMIESHFDPKSAWSDSHQQITPENLFSMLKKLEKFGEKKNLKNLNLDKLRILIDELDDNIISILSERMNLSKKLGFIKKSSDITILQPKRWESILDRSVNRGKNLGLSESFLKNLFQLLHQESVKIQNKVKVTD